MESKQPDDIDIKQENQRKKVVMRKQSERKGILEGEKGGADEKTFIRRTLQL